jgi:hypothetical protein
VFGINFNMNAMVSRFSASPDALSRELQGEILILDLKSSHYFGLTGPAARIWQLVEAGGDVDEIVATLAREFDADSARIKEDTHAFLNDLVSRGLLIPAAS